MANVFEVHRDADGVDAAAAERIASIAQRAVDERGRFSVALSGGPTPCSLYRVLSGEPFRTRLPWSATHVFWSDERAVPPESATSHFRIARECLLDHVAIPTSHVHRIEGERDPDDAAARYSRLLADVLGDGSLDLVLLELGRDGHVASLFPGAAALFSDAQGALACHVDALSEWRITLSLPEINRAAQVMLLVRDPNKASAIVDVRSGYSGLPAARIAPAGDAAWYLDRATAEAARALDARLNVGDHVARPTDVDAAKRRAGAAAAALVDSDMRVGLGTGSTARHVVEAIGRRLREGTLRGIVAVPTSEATAALARSEGIPLASLAEVARLDIAIDGADEISPDLDLVKGLGGALLREKIVAHASERFVVVADAAKLVARLGSRSPVPVAVAPFGWQSHLEAFRALGADPVLRVAPDGSPVVTDDGLHIVDCRFEGGVADPPALERALRARPGVVETGLFLGIASAAFVDDGRGVVRYYR